ncbi:MAG: hypothetical protein ABIR96_00455 [Bdellovibrionota bacterium]
MTIKTLAATLSLGVLLSSCASLNSTSLSSIPAKRDQVVHAEAARTIILGFNFDNDFVNTLEGDLQKQCPGGDVRGILTKDEVIDYFLFIVWKRKVTADGYCVGGAKS